ncbi:hypothetical protein F0U59_38605 [Archangium gephyra]|nr:hypothetical protein F0U59_38605 [Archangium gephyra]
MSTTYKIHPGIGIARVGNSDDYYLAPVTAGGLPQETNGTPVSQFRDNQNRIRRQAARFSVYVYDQNSPNGRLLQFDPNGIVDIEWKVRLANKKAAWRKFLQLYGENGYDANHPYRNPLTVGDDRKKLIIDPGPQTVRCTSGTTQAEFAQGKGPAGYAQTFPPALTPYGITTLGELQTEPEGSLIVAGGHGNSGVDTRYPYTLSTELLNRETNPFPSDVVAKLQPIQNNAYTDSASLDADLEKVLGADTDDYKTWGPQLITAAQQPRIDDYANNNYWFDDTSDGPVTATLILYNGDRVTVDAPAWVLVGPPAYAPQLLNMVTLYDTLYDVAVREFGYNPKLYSNGKFDESYIPNTQAEIQPILKRPAAYRWVADINDQGVQAHKAANSDPYSNFFDYLRKPGDFNRAGQMPQLAGDNPLNNSDRRNYLTLTQTQYFLLSQYNNGQRDTSPPVDNSGDGEKLDRAVLENCVGGPFCPGIEITWICRNPAIYSQPFRLKHKPLSDTQGLSLSEDLSQGMEPGDCTRYMALPWQADFNECSDEYFDNKNIWWWPSQRPYMVYPKDNPDTQKYWTRNDSGNGADNYTDDKLMIYNWKDLGFIVQQAGTPPFVEVERLSPEMPDPTFEKPDPTF